MALNFPSSPTPGQIYTDTTSGFSYEWDGTVWKSYSASNSSQIQILDDISASFDSVTQTFPLTSNTSPITPPSSQSLIINLGGVVQDPTDDYSISGSNIVFSTAPVNGLSFSGVSLGPAVPINTIPNGTVTDGSLRISTKAVVGSATTFTEDLVVNGSARVTGILTVGTGSVTIDGSTNVINVGTGVTIYGNSGIISATQFVGDGSGLTGAGSTVADDTTTNAAFYPVLTQTTTGTVTATKVSTSKLSFNPSTGSLSATAFVGDGSGLTGAGSTVADDTTTNQTFYPIFTQTTSGTVTSTKVSTTKLTFNPSTGLVVAGIVSATGIGTLGTNGTGARTVSTGSPTGGSNGDIWYKY